MKKWILVALLLLLLTLAGSYFLMPQVQQLETKFFLQVNARSLHRTLLQQSLQAQQQRKNEAQADSVRLLPSMENSFLLQVPTGKGMHNSQIMLMGLSPDSSMVYWNAVVRGGNLPWQRWNTWRQSRHIEKEATAYLARLKAFEDEQLLYGFGVTYEKVKDSVMVATRFTTPTYPSTKDIYDRIHLLRQYIAAQGAQATNPPMLHVQQADSGFLAQVAIPTNRPLPDKGKIFFRRMVLGNILQAEVKGGQATVEKGLRQLENYVSEHGLTSPAIPFAQLVTDRSKVLDSSHWITRIYYPIY